MSQIESLLEEWDGEEVIIRRDEPTGSWIIIAVHSTRLGPTVGGTRMKPYPDLEAALRDALRLSSGMTIKFAVPNLPYGGGKAVIKVPENPDRNQRAALLGRYGKLVHQLSGLFNTGPDVGISSQDMDIIGETGAPYVFSRTPEAGGAGSPGPFTALGVFTAMEVVCERIFGEGSLKDRKILVQGAGSVGEALIDILSKAGAEIYFTDVDEATVSRIIGKHGARFIPPGEIFTTECDIFAPCALGGVLSFETIPVLKCSAVAGGANNQLAQAEDAERLRARGILYSPDYVNNIGGAMAIIGMETRGWSRREAEKNVIESVGTALRKVFKAAVDEGITTEEAARRLAEEHLAS